jgi:hypothetical protein
VPKIVSKAAMMPSSFLFLFVISILLLKLAQASVGSNYNHKLCAKAPPPSLK